MDKIKYKWIVWVGSCDDYYVHYKDAKRDYNHWINKGYDDVIIEKIKDTKSTQSFTDWVLDFQEQHQELLSKNNYEDIILEKAVDNFDK